MQIKEPVLTTPRLTMVAVSEDLADDFFPIIEASAPELSLWLPWAIRPSMNALRDFARSSARSWMEGREWPFWFLHEGAPAGGVGINHYLSGQGTASIGYWVRSDMTRKGLTTEAASAVVEWAFTEKRLHRLELRASPGNIGSVRVAEKLGFRLEGRSRESGLGRDGYHDHNIYGLLESDPRNRYH